MRAATSVFRAGRIAEPEYQARTEAFWRLIGVELPAGAIPAGGGGTLAPRPRPAVTGRGLPSPTGSLAWLASTTTVS